jgi:hypothetical protein
MTVKRNKKEEAVCNDGKFKKEVHCFSVLVNSPLINLQKKARIHEGLSLRGY